MRCCFSCPANSSAIVSLLVPSSICGARATACRYVNNNDTRQNNNLGHYANLVVDVEAVMKLVKSMLRVQQAAMMCYSFDNNA
jgi:hypothetical protein